MLSAVTFGTTYYVSSSGGNDTNAGTSASSPWQTIAHVNAQSLQPGDSVLFKRGDAWNESLAPASSGTAGNPIAFDAYGAGAAPNLTGWYAVPSSAWVLVTGNAWKAPVPSIFTTVSFCLFGSVWGEKVAASTTSLTAQWDFYLANGYLYVFSVGRPSLYYTGSIVPMALSNVPVINVNGRSWLTFQHFLINWFDDFGVYVQGASDHLVFANLEADSMIPQGTQPLGFYVNESAPGPGDIKIYNSSAHMNYDGFRFDGAASAITLVNDAGYANRDGALVDNLTYVSGSTTVDDTAAVTYSYCHFYASSLAVAGSTDVESPAGTAGPTVGAGNIAADVAPAVQAWERYPARVTLTVDDVGMTPGADSYYAGSVLPVADAAGVPVGTAITVGYASVMTPTVVSEIQSWINAGRDVTAHSVSHTYYTNTDALDVQYIGSGTAAALSISNKVLTITVTGASDSVSYNLAQGQAQGTILALYTALNATGKFTVSLSPLPCQGPYGTGCSIYTGDALLSQDLADVSGQDVKSSMYHMQLDVTLLTTDEITLSRSWMTQNLTGFPSTPVYVYPGGYENPNMESIAAGVPYQGARGALHMGGTANNGQPITGDKDTYASGLNVQDITSFGVNPSWMGSAGVTAAMLNQKIQALVWKEQVWGVPWGIFWHNGELTQNDPVGGTEITNLIQDFKNAGATVMTNTALVNWVTSGTLAAGTGTTDGNYYYKSAAASPYPQSGGVDFRPTAASPVVNAGQNLGAAYAIDINGLNQNSYGSGWEIGAHAYVPYTIYGEGGSSYFSLGVEQTVGCGFPTYQCYSTSLATINYPSVTPNVGGLTGAGTTFTDPTWGATGVRVTDANFDPSMAGSANNSFAVSNGGSADDNWFNTNDTLTLVTNQGGFRYLVGLNPATLGISRPYATNTSGCPLGSCAARGGWATSADLGFSTVNPYLLYAQSGTSLESYLFDGPAFANPPSPVTVANYIENSPPSCTGAACSCLPSDFGTPTWADFAGVTSGDAVFGEAFSSNAYHYGSSTVQGSGYYVAVYSPVKGCMAMNTQTGAITADPGWAGGSGLACTAAQCTGTSTATQTFTIHNVKLNKAGTQIAIQWTTCISGTCTSNVPFLWMIGTTTVYPSQVGKTGGHWALGTQGMLNDPGSPLYQYQYRTEQMSGAGTATAVNAVPSPACMVSVDGHQSWNTNNGSDTAPFGFTRYSGALQSYGLLPFDQPQCAWWNEIDFADMNGDGLVHREALTYNTGYSIFFDVSQNIGTFSQTGNFAAVGSDWFNTLGNAGGTSSSCIANGPKWKSGFAYATNYVMNPVDNNAANDSFVATIAGTSGATEPNWGTSCSTTCTDSGVTWTNIGAPSGVSACRGDVFLWKFNNAMADVYVSPVGSDSNAGTMVQPLATIAKAQSVVQGLSRARTNPIKVTLLGGTYSLCASLPCTPLSFRASDSGSSAVPVVWQAFPESAVVIDGAYHLAGGTATSACGGSCTKYTWQPAGAIYTEQFWYNGARRLRPRAGSGALGSYYRLRAGTTTNALPYTVGDPPDLSAAWVNLHSSWNGTGCAAISGNNYPDGDIQVLVFEQEGVSKLPLWCVDTANHVMYVTGNTSLPTVAGNRYLVENIKPANDAAAVAGTWFLDRSTSPYTFIYYANAGESPNTDVPGAEAPQLPGSAPSVLSAQGLSWVTFSGMTFLHDNWVVGSGGYTYNRLDDAWDVTGSTVGAAFSCVGCANVTLNNVTVAETAGAGISFLSCVVVDKMCPGANAAWVSTNNTVANSFLYDLGAHGVRVGLLSHSGDTDGNIAQHTTVENTLVQGIGRVLPKSFAIAQGCGHDNLYTQDDIDDSYGGGINIGALNCPPGGANSTGSFNNVASYNHIWNLGEGLTNDFGGVYFNVGTPTFVPAGNQVLYNRVHDISDASSQDASGFAGQGIYIDNFTGNVTVTGNLVYRTSSVPMNFTSGPNMANAVTTVTNNVFALGRFGMVNLNDPWANATCPGCTVLKASLQDNIFYFDRTASSNPAFYFLRGCAYSGTSSGAGHGGDSLNLYMAFAGNTYYSTAENFGTDAQAFHYQTTQGAAGGNSPYCSNGASNWTFLGAAAWQAAPYNEDAGSAFSANPGFVSPSCAAAGGTDNWGFSGAAPGGFSPLPIAAMGRASGVGIGAVAGSLPTQGFNCGTDY